MSNLNPAPIFITYARNPSKIAGYYDPDDGNIYIRTGLSKYRQLLIYVHERQHKKCHDEKCSCWSRGTFHSEYHAYRAELDYVIERESPRLWKLYFRNVMADIIKQSSDLKLWGGHRRAILKVCRLKRFQEHAKEHGVLHKINLVIKRTAHGK